MKTTHAVLLRLVALVLLAASPPIVRAAGKTITIGQSLPLSGVAFYNARRVLAGAETYVAYLNAQGG